MLSHLRTNLFLLPLLALPSYLLRFSIHGLPFNILDLLLFLAIITNLSLLNNLKFPRYLFSIVSLLLFSALLAVFTAHFATNALGALKSWFLLPILYALLLSRSSISLPLIRRCLLISLSATLLYALWIFPGDPTHRLHGWYSNPNLLAMLSETLLLFTFPVVLEETKPWRTLWFILLGISLLTVSIGGYIALIAGFLVIFIAQNQRKFLPHFFILLTCIMVGITFLPPSRQPINTFGSRSGSAEGRTQIWATAYYLIAQHPLTGIGLYQFQPNYRQALPQITNRPLENEVPFAHNFYLSVWTNLGLLGLVSFILLFIYLIQSFLHTKEIALFAALAAVLAHGIIDTPYFLNDLSLLFWIMVIVTSVRVLSSQKLNFRWK